MEAGALFYELISNSSTLKTLQSISYLFPSLTKFLHRIGFLYVLLAFQTLFRENLKCHANVYLAKTCNNIMLYLSYKHGSRGFFYICKQTSAHTTNK